MPTHYRALPMRGFRFHRAAGGIMTVRDATGAVPAIRPGAWPRTPDEARALAAADHAAADQFEASLLPIGRQRHRVLDDQARRAAMRLAARGRLYEDMARHMDAAEVAA